MLERDNEVFCIEIKSAERLYSVDQRGFESFASYYKKPFHRIVLYRGEVSKDADGVLILPWQEGLRHLGL